MMILRYIIFLLFVCSRAVYGDVCLPSVDTRIVGVATHAKTGVFLYCEYHVIGKDTSQVIYTDDAQQPIAMKTVDYSMSLLAPNILQRDYRHDEIVAVTRQQSSSEQVLDTLFLEYTPANGGKTRKKMINDQSNLIVDAGFDHAIRHYWASLTTQKKVILTFVVPAKARTVQLLVKETRLSRCRLPKASAVNDNNDQHICYLVKPKSALLRWFVKPISLLYERDTQRLLFFSGSSNVSSNTGKGQMVDIEYRYY
jgi:hypothetical protein